MKTIEEIKKEKKELEKQISGLIYDFSQKNQDIELDISVNVCYEKIDGTNEKSLNNIDVNINLSI
jgi:stress response protein SCP2